MKKGSFLFLLLYCWCSSELYAQAVYIDPTTSGAMLLHAGVVNSNMDKTNSNLTAIQKAQLLVTGQLTAINTIQNNIYKGLTEVNAIVKNSLAVKDVADMAIDIYNDGNKALELAKGNPELLLFAEAGVKEFKNRAVALSTEISSFVLVGGKGNMMDAGERSKLLQHIKLEMMRLRGIAYGIYRSMYWAKMRGFWNSINPYSGYVNRDKQLAEDIFRKVKILKP